MRRVDGGVCLLATSEGGGGRLGRPAVLAGATHNERLERWMSRERTMLALWSAAE